MVDYSKWDHIELSDDDTETLPKTIDKKSFEQYQKNKRAERDLEEQQQRVKMTKRLEVVKDKVAQLGKSGLEHEAGQKLIAEQRELEMKLMKLEKFRNWNADNMCKTAEQRTIINSYPEDDTVPATNDFKDGEAKDLEDDKAYVEGYAEFCEKYASEADHFLDKMSLQSLNASESYLMDRPYLVTDHGQNYMMLDCLEKEMNGKHKEMVQSARQQVLVVQCIELAKGTKKPVQAAVKAIFEKLQHEDQGEEFRNTFDQEVRKFIERVEKRAVTKKKEMDEEVARNSDSEDEHLRAEDPEVQKVLDGMPRPMYKAFKNQDITALHHAVAALPREEGKHWMRRCEEVGLWNAGENEEPPYRQED